MPITINGDGTITGISAGGLPDNSVQTADIADDQITLAKMAGGTDGQIITYDASGNPVAVGPGTDGQVLTSTGAGSPPAFEASGKILQVVQTVKTDTFSHEVSDTSFHSTGFQVSITPIKASSKILLMYSVHIGSDTNNRVYLQIQRSINSGSYTAIGIGDTISNRFRATTGSMLHHGGDKRVHAAHYLDSPSYSLTNAIIYRLYGYVHATQYFYINRSHNNNDDDSHATPISTITAIEVGA